VVPLGGCSEKLIRHKPILATGSLRTHWPMD
jgi:hypothetical protein